MTNMLNTTTLQAVSFLLFLAALPLVSFGTMEDQELLWYAGLVLIVAAGILPPLGRFLVSDDDGDEEADGADGHEGDQADEGDPANDDAVADDAADAESDGAGEVTTDAPHSAGPIGRGAGSAGREPHRQRVQEQEEHSSSQEDDR
ncbi:MAG TPA: hypothetical protein VM305_09455 [Candidatus Limnocylindrales bacterium]|nr:hypothetical protein [Candidatus Limnocylindrales bacterium]